MPVYTDYYIKMKAIQTKNLKFFSNFFMQYLKVLFSCVFFSLIFLYVSLQHCVQSLSSSSFAAPSLTLAVRLSKQLCSTLVWQKQPLLLI